MKKRILSAFLAICLVVTLLPTLALASEATFSDMPSDYSTAALKAAVSNGLLKGSDGKILPNDPLTRAQMAAIIVRAFGATEEALLTGYTDVSSAAWYYKDLGKAVKMKVLQGDGVRLNPEDTISRQQAFAVLARALKLKDGTSADLSGFSDKSSVASWAVGTTAAMVNAGFIQGSNGKLNPTANISRKDFAVMMNNIFKTYVNSTNAVTELAAGTVLINVPGTSLKDVTVKGDLIIGDGVGNGDVTLDNVIVTGRMIVRGGGVNSIIIRGNSSVGEVVVSKVDGNVRIAVEGGANVEIVYINDGKDDVIVEGSVDKLVIDAPSVPVTIKGGTVGEVSVNSNNATVMVDKTATVTSMTASGSEPTLTVQGTVKTLTATAGATGATIEVAKGGAVDTVNAGAPDTAISGEGSVKNANVTGNNVSVDTKGTEVKVSEGVTGTTAGGNDVKPGETANTGTGTTGGSPGGGGGGGSSVAVSAISVDKEATTLPVGTSETLVVTFDPTNATNKNVTWSSSDAEIATVADGVVTAVSEGTATITATSNNGKTATTTVTVVAANTVAMIGTTQYDTLEDAVATVLEDETITLVVNASGDGIVVPEGKNFTLDLGGNTYTVDGDTVGSTGTETNGFQLLRDSNITIQNGKITTDKAKILIQNYSNLTLYDVDLVGADVTQYVLSNNYGNTKLENGTTITAADGQVAFDVYYGLSAAYDAGVSVTIADTDVVIDGVYEYGKDGRVNDAKWYEKATLIIPEGYELAAPAGFKWVAQDGKQVLIDASTVAMIGPTQYDTLEDAVATVLEDETITLVVNASGDGIVVPEGKNFTLDLGGNTYTVDGDTVGSTGTETNGFQLLRDSNITIQNGKITTDKAKILIQNYSNLTLYDVDLVGADVTQYVLSNNYGNTKLENGTTITAADGQVAFDVYYGLSAAYDAGVSVTIADTDVVIDGVYEYGKDGRVNDAKWYEKATLIIPEGYELAAPAGFKWVAQDGKQVLIDASTVAMIGPTQYDSLKAAINAAANGSTINVIMDCTIVDATANNKNLTFIGNNSKPEVTFPQKGYQTYYGCEFTFENLTLECAPDENYQGIQPDKVIARNCVINGKFWGYAKDLEFTGCIFNQETSYNIWTYGSNVTFENCEFNSAGRSVLIYNEGATKDNPAKIVFNECEFINKGEVVSEKAAIEISTYAYPDKGGSFEVEIDNCSATGFDTETPAGGVVLSPGLAHLKKIGVGTLTVTIDGQEMYPVMVK